MKTVIFFSLGLGCITLPLSSAQPVSPPRIEWQQTIGGTANDWPMKVIEIPDGSFFIGGMTWSPPSGNKTSPRLDSELRSIEPDEDGDAWLIKLNNSGIKEWDRSYGGVGADAFVDMVPARDGGVFIGGTGFRGEVIPLDIPCLDPFCGWAWFVGSKDYFVARTDATGHTLWQQFLGGDHQESLAGLVVGLDNSVTLAGSSISPPERSRTAPLFGGADGWIVGIDSYGRQQWDRSFGGTSSDSIDLAKRTADGGMILAGASNSGLDGNKSVPSYGLSDVWIVRLNAVGEKTWEQSLGGVADEYPASVFEMPDGGAIVGCVSHSPPSGNKSSPLLDEGLSPFDFRGDIWLVRLDPSGRILWDKSLGTKYADWLIAIEPTPEGGVIVCTFTLMPSIFTGTGYVHSPDELHIAKVGPLGDELWNVSFTNKPGLLFADWNTRIVVLDDGGMLVGLPSTLLQTTGAQPPTIYDLNDCWLLRLDAQGNRVWDMTLGGGGKDFLTALGRTKDGGFIVAMASDSIPVGNNGNKTDPGYGMSDAWIVKLSPELPPDSDGDGVPDELDQCPNTPAGGIVNASGCTIDQLAPCNGPWKNHGQYVKEVIKVSRQFRKAGLISHKQRLQIFLDAVKSDCGRKLSRKRVDRHDTRP